MKLRELLDGQINDLLTRIDEEPSIQETESECPEHIDESQDRESPEEDDDEEDE